MSLPLLRRVTVLMIGVYSFPFLPRHLPQLYEQSGGRARSLCGQVSSPQILLKLFKAMLSWLYANLIYLYYKVAGHT
jgi:hypothetical protein